MSDSKHDWHLDKANYREEQIREMPTWIKTNKETFILDETYDVVHVKSFSEMQKLAYSIVQSHSGGSRVSQNKLPQLILGYIYILKYLQSNFIG